MRGRRISLGNSALLFVVFCFETMSNYEGQPGFELPCLTLPSAEITAVKHHVPLYRLFLINLDSLFSKPSLSPSSGHML